MANRLASFKGPSAPSSAPVSPQNTNQKKHSNTPKKQGRQSTPTPASPSSRQQQQNNGISGVESTFHRRLRASLQELSAISGTWDELVLIDGLKAAKKLVDRRTELECVFGIGNVLTLPFWLIVRECRNDLSQIPNRLPRTHMVTTRLAVMDKCIEDLDVIIHKLVCALSFDIWKGSFISTFTIAAKTVPKNGHDH